MLHKMALPCQALWHFVKWAGFLSSTYNLMLCQATLMCKASATFVMCEAFLQCVEVCAVSGFFCV